MVGLQPFRAELKRAERSFKRDLSKELKKAGRDVQRAIRQSFGPRTNPRTRQRRPGSDDSKLNRMTGAAQRGVKIRRLVVRSARDYLVVIGPPKPGAAQVGFHLRLHEEGLGRLPVRSVVVPGVRRSAEKVFRRIGRSVRVLTLDRR